MLSPFKFLNDINQRVKSDPSQAQLIYEKARDRILSDHSDAIDCAAALFDAATSLHKQPPSDASWKLLEDIRASSDRTTPSNDETRKRRALASLVAIWSLDIVSHYGWTGSSRVTVELLRQCALTFPDFEMQLAPLARCILVRRHEESMFNSRIPSVGEHHSTSKGGLAQSPLTNNDIQLLASVGRHGEGTALAAYGVALQPKLAGSVEELDFQQRWCEDGFDIEVRGKPLLSLRPMQTQNFLLGLDRFGLLVPRRFAVAPSKRRRISARSKPQTEETQCLPASRRDWAGYSSVKAAAFSHKGSATMKVKLVNRKGEMARKDMPDASVHRSNEVHSNETQARIGRDRERDTDRVSSSITEHNSQPSAPACSTHSEERCDLQRKVQQAVRKADDLRPGVRGQAASEARGLAHKGISEDHDGTSISTQTSNNSSLAKVSAQTREAQDPRISGTREMDGMSLRALDLAKVTNFQRQPARGISLDCAIRQRHFRLVKTYTALVEKHPGDQAEHQARKSWLRTDTSWAKIFTIPESDLGHGESATEYDADVIYASGKHFHDISQQGKTFDKPVVIKEAFADAGLVTLGKFASLLFDRHRRDTLQVRSLGHSVTKSVAVPEFVGMLEAGNTPGPDDPHYGLNALDFHGVTACSRPLFTHLRRFRLLETLCEADDQRGPGKRIFRGGVSAPCDISDSLSFNIMGFEGAFSGPHMDALAGTWVRNLCGIKFWMIVSESEMTSGDWDDFYESGSHWSPNGKERLIVLEPDDVLFMPPGLRVIHAVHTPQSSLMEGGMLWDERNLLRTLSVLRDIGFHQTATNEPIPFQLPRIVRQLEDLVSADPARFARGCTDFAPRFEDAICALKELGCSCSKPTCFPSQCSCRREDRRCTSFCLKHTDLPPKSGRTCMTENGMI